MRFADLINNLPALLSALLIAILFIQSGLDKVVDWKGNLEWLTGHFSKTFLRGTVPPMLAAVTLMELVAGFLSLIGIVYFFATGAATLIFYAAVIGAVSVVCLFFGQRVAKDYPGAAILVPYFILLLVLMYLTAPARQI